MEPSNATTVTRSFEMSNKSFIILRFLIVPEIKLNLFLSLLFVLKMLVEIELIFVCYPLILNLLIGKNYGFRRMQMKSLVEQCLDLWISL